MSAWPVMKFSSAHAGATSVLALAVVLAVAVGAASPVTARESPVVLDAAASNLTPGAASSLSTVSPLPSRPQTYQTAPPSVIEGQIGAASNPGPVTGYGPGGMGRIPGTAPNLIYHFNH